MVKRRIKLKLAENEGKQQTRSSNRWVKPYQVGWRQDWWRAFECITLPSEPERAKLWSK